MAVTPRKLSNSPNGLGIVLATAAAGTLLHTSTTATGASQFDELYIWASNRATTSKVVTFYLGATGSSNHLHDSLPARAGFYQIVPGLRFSGGVAVRAFTTSPGVVIVNGIVNRNA